MRRYYHAIEGMIQYSTGYEVWFKMEQKEIRLADLEVIIKQNGENHLP